RLVQVDRLVSRRSGEECRVEQLLDRGGEHAVGVVAEERSAAVGEPAGGRQQPGEAGAGGGAPSPEREGPRAAPLPGDTRPPPAPGGRPAARSLRDLARAAERGRVGNRGVLWRTGAGFCQAGSDDGTGCSSVRYTDGSTGLTRWASNPAARDRLRSSSAAY